MTLILEKFQTYGKEQLSCVGYRPQEDSAMVPRSPEDPESRTVPRGEPFTVGLSASHLLAGLSVPEGDLQAFNSHLQPQVALLREKRFMKGLTD